MKSYAICAPLPTRASAGVSALHRLSDDLKTMGQESRVILLQGFETISRNEIVIYPDTTEGNPLRSKNVVRYLLMYAGYFGHEAIFPETELLFYHSEDFVLNGRSADNVLTLPVTTESRFPYASLEERSCLGVCYLARKYQEVFGLLPIDLPPGAFEIRNETNLPALFTQVKRLITFDNSAINLEAALAGIEVEYRFNETFQKPISLGRDFDWKDARNSYLRLKERYWKEQLPHFIQASQERFQ